MILPEAFDLFKKFVQQGRSLFWAQNVPAAHAHGKMARTPLTAFFIRPDNEENFGWFASVKLFDSVIRVKPYSFSFTQKSADKTLLSVSVLDPHRVF